MRKALPSFLIALLLIAGLIGARTLAQSAAEAELAATEMPPGVETAGDDFDFFSDDPIDSEEVVELPPEKSHWITIGGPIALLLLFFAMLVQIWWLVPFERHSLDLNLRELPPAAKRGIAMAVGMFGVAFCFGAAEIWYQLRIHGSSEAYFAQMSLGKLIAFTHAHLFGFTTSFFIIGIPFSMQFNHLKVYQWVFPVGLAASLTDVMSWWGIKFLSANFEWISVFCGIVFSVSYLWMLIGLLRTLLFPEVIWLSDKDRETRLAARRARSAAEPPSER